MAGPSDESSAQQWLAHEPAPNVMQGSVRAKAPTDTTANNPPLRKETQMYLTITILRWQFLITIGKRYAHLHDRLPFDPAIDVQTL